MSEMFAISIEPGFERVIKKLDQLAIEQNSNRSAVTRAIFYEYFGIEPLPKTGSMNRSDQLKRRRDRR